MARMEHDSSLDWHLLEERTIAGCSRWCAISTGLYRAEPALWEGDNDPVGFQWIDANNADENVIAFMRVAPTWDAASYAFATSRRW